MNKELLNEIKKQLSTDGLLSKDGINLYTKKIEDIHFKLINEENNQSDLESKMDYISLQRDIIQARIRNLIEIQNKLNKKMIKYIDEHSKCKSNIEKYQYEIDQEEKQFNFYLSNRDDYIVNIKESLKNNNNTETEIEYQYIPNFDSTGSMFNN